MKLPLSLAFLGAVLCSGIQAQTPQQGLSVDELVQALTPQKSSSRTRSLRNLKVEPAKVDLAVNFDFDSARIQPSSKPQLQKLAVAMKHDALLELRFQVEGHTDAKGGAGYNQLLSEKRAQSVTLFLQQQGISAIRLNATGKGFTELLNKEDPLASENRRVRITTLD